jgi:hypothetical protein
MLKRVFPLIVLLLSALLAFWMLSGSDGRSNDAARTGIVGDAANAAVDAVGKLPDRPYVRWWWFADVIEKQDVEAQLRWVRDNGFGGVEIAWVYPLHGDTARARLPWLSGEWSAAVAHAAQTCDRLGLGCDFTFGTLWPFGDSRVAETDGTLLFGDSVSAAAMRLTWEHPRKGRVINHLDRAAFERYATRLTAALDEALHENGGPPAVKRGLFCDSWEVETRGLWTRGFDALFQREHGYDIRPLMDSLYLPGYEEVHYDYMKIISRLVREEFYEPFTRAAHAQSAYTRAQCCGAPTDLLRAYAAVDVPETEAILFEPAFARIAASAAVFGAKSYVSAESFTCLYGWKGWPGPGPHQGEERIADLRLLADALFAHGVNHLIWHGMPYNPPGRSEKFYAAVHVGPDAGFAAELPAFNEYLAAVSSAMRKGHSAGDIAVYLPLEDAWMDVALPDSLQFPWAWGEYEMRYQRTPDFLKGYQPLWINADFLRRAVVRRGRLLIGDAAIRAVYVDARFLDLETLTALKDVASAGVEVCVARTPAQPGRRRSPAWSDAWHALRAEASVHRDPRRLLRHAPLVTAPALPDFWCRDDGEGRWLFFSHPAASELRYPLAYAAAALAKEIEVPVTLHWKGRRIPYALRFAKGKGALLHITRAGSIRRVSLPGD